MALKQTYSCDVCGVDRKEINHWFSIWIENKIFKTKQGISPDSKMKHVCGSDHAMTLYARFLSHGMLDMEHKAEINKPTYPSFEPLTMSNEGYVSCFR